MFNDCKCNNLVAKIFLECLKNKTNENELKTGIISYIYSQNSTFTEYSNARARPSLVARYRYLLPQLTLLAAQPLSSTH